jgi:methionine synthase II (cobalamin-independent)
MRGAGIEPPLIKACLVGPWSTGHHSAHATAARLGPVIRALFAAGAPVVQLTEPALGDIDPDDHRALDQLESVLASVAADVDGHLSLAVAGGRPTRIPHERLFAAPFASYLFDLIQSPDDWQLCARVPATSGLIVGVADARTPDPDTEAVSIWGARYAASLAGRGPSRVGITMSAGLELLPRDAARAKLAALAEAGRKAELPDAELAKVIDPRAVDARSAALGRYEPPPRRG